MRDKEKAEAVSIRNISSTEDDTNPPQAHAANHGPEFLRTQRSPALTQARRSRSGAPLWLVAFISCFRAHLKCSPKERVEDCDLIRRVAGLIPSH